ncbi:hypothetical protein KFE25_005618 [Diacronema lutheri]|uniref:BTB domain-containing protein n=1 Tax=Diacronema lutheri TaxID=2081491 RepID=A0A8J5XJV7_DIALT|nr:hypothetical protein KFE25_005618 [Diacronema lutheri]
MPPPPSVRLRARTGNVATLLVPESALCHVSSVLAGILADGDRREPRVLTLDADDVQVRAFVRLVCAHAHSQRDGALLTVEDCVQFAVHAIPLLHKYDAVGVLNAVKAAMCALARLNPSSLLRCALEALFVAELEAPSAEWIDRHLVEFIVRCARGEFEARDWVVNERMPRAVEKRVLNFLLSNSYTPPPTVSSPPRRAYSAHARAVLRPTASALAPDPFAPPRFDAR